MESRAARGEAYNVQNVRFQKKRLRPRDVAVTFLTVYMCSWVCSKLVLEPVGKAIAEADPGPDPDEEIPPFFIPFPGTTKVLERRKYLASDPEFQEFVKFCKTEGQVRHVKEELAYLMRKIVRGHPVFTARYGSDINVSGYWLNLSFSAYAPPQIVRSGIEITDDYIAWSTMPVEPETVFRIRRALWPSAMAMSLWSFAKVIVTDDVKNAARILGLRIGGNTPTIEELLSQQQQKLSKLSPPEKERSASKQAQLLGDSQSQKSVALSTENSNLTKKVSTQEELTAGPVKRAVSAISEHFSRGILEFKTKLRQSWMQTPGFPPGGSILTEGLIELEAQKAWIVLYARAFWDPKTNKYDLRTLHVRLAHVQPKSLGPVHRGSKVLR